ncbi:MAG: fatty acid desaturase family protein [Pseudonocardiaceae bacterium]
MVPASVSAVPATGQGQGSDFAELSRIVKRAGLLRRRSGYYVVKGALTIAVLAAAWVVFGYVGNSWWQLFTAAFLAVVYTQLSFIGHDAGHKQIFRGRRANTVVGLVHGGLVGLSYGWWIGKHNRHHANPNHEDDDPDLDIPALAFTKRQGRAKRGALRWIAKYQAFLFFPLLLLEGLILHWSSIQAVWRGEVKSRKVEKALLIAHIGAYLTAVFLVLSPLTAVVFIAVHRGLWGVYMGCSFAPNHKGMPTLADDHTLDFLRKQVLTSRNVRGRRWVDFTLGGLNYQIEHHLFPSMPRPNLRHAQPIVHDFCVEHGITYSQCGLLRSYGHVLDHLHAVGAPLRAARS